MTIRLFSVLVMVIGLAAGCSRSESSSTEDKPADSGIKADMKLAVEGFTGKTAVKNGRKAMDTIEKVSAQKNDDLNEVMP